ncbi:MAG: hypothetical protein QNJ63_00655 [Calothrix sp. MO_192.B10]|nr:hypothetical protein [Calothrix sp. MO_192.B10]
MSWLVKIVFNYLAKYNQPISYALDAIAILHFLTTGCSAAW